MISNDDKKTILSADNQNRANPSDLVKKVAARKPLGRRQRSQLEGELANATPEQNHTKYKGRSRSENELTIQSRRKRIIRMRMKWPPMTVRAIAEELDISVSTVMTDIQALRQQYLQADIAKENAEELGKALAEYDVMEKECLRLADSYTAANDKAPFLREARAYKQARIALMQDAGLIRKNATQVQLSAPGGGPIEVRVQVSIRDRIEKLRARMEDAIVVPTEPKS